MKYIFMNFEIQIYLRILYNNYFYAQKYEQNIKITNYTLFQLEIKPVIQ